MSRPRTATGLAEEIKKEKIIHLHMLASNSRSAVWYAVRPRYVRERARCGTEQCYILRLKGHKKNDSKSR